MDTPDPMFCRCCIVPKDVLERLARDRTLTSAQRKSFADAASFELEWRRGRIAQARLSTAARALVAGVGSAVATPAITVYDCRHETALPGVPMPPPGDATARRVFAETRAVADFYQQIFGRNSVDDAGRTLISSIHFGVNYSNAFWNGSQMTYGDGDGSIFVDFTLSNDVIAHELTHGVTQFSSRFAYTNQAGGLNESMSDVFGSMFRQWRAGQTVDQADWLIGKDILGPAAIARGYRCLRDMANPAAAHCLSPQVKHYSKYKAGMDPHHSSGIPNLAFCNAAKAIGGGSWEKAGRIWYVALTDSAARPTMRMKTFANRTRKLAKTLFPGDAAVSAAVDRGWLGVGL